MRKVTKQSLDELAKRMTLISSSDQMSFFWGGCHHSPIFNLIVFIMKRKKEITSLLIAFIAGMILTADCYAQFINYNTWNIADNDTLFFINPETKNLRYPITGAIFKAINPRFIANTYGFTKYEIVAQQENNENCKLIEKKTTKDFSLISTGYYFDPDSKSLALSTSKNIGKEEWTYYINDVQMDGYSLVLVSALTLQAIERVEFTGESPNIKNSNTGTVRIYTRDLSKSISDDSKTVYILNDDRVITHKIFEAIYPVYIRSLTRITDKEELAKYEHKDITEIVKVNLFEIGEVANLVIAHDCPECYVYLIDNIQIDWKSYFVLNPFHFKEVCEIQEDDNKSFSPYRNLFAKQKLKFSKTVTIISLDNNDNPCNIDNNEMIRFINPLNSNIYNITGTTFNALDPKFIANISGFTKSLKMKEENIKKVEKMDKKEFSLISFNYRYDNEYEASSFFSSLNIKKEWIYYINDELMDGNNRSLVSALKNQAIERVELTTDSGIVFTYDETQLPQATYRNVNAIHFYTRDLANSTINDSKTVYILNDGQVITRKIFEAIYPVCINSLKRITNKQELTEYGYKDITNIVKISLFNKEEMTNVIKIPICPECNVYIVDNIQVSQNLFEMLNPFHFKVVREIDENEQDYCTSYIDFFSKEKNNLRKKVTFVSL